MSQTIAPFSFQFSRSAAGLLLEQTLHAPANHVIWLVGNSGSGKSTFLNLLKGFFPEFIAGTLTGAQPNAFEGAAYIAQNPLSQIIHERVGEEFFFPMENARWSQAAMLAARHWLADFGLADDEFAPTAILSHGLSQRLLLASMLAVEPQWLAFDEPSAFLNPAMRDAFYAHLAALKGKVGMVLIDHHPHVAALADICWHVADDGVITSMSVAQWQARQADDLRVQAVASPYTIAQQAIPQGVSLQLDSLQIGYRNRRLFTATACLNSGECAVLLGENGVGKSTFFNTLAGTLKPLSGQLSLCLNGAPLKKPASQMAYVFQHPDSHFYFDTVAEELAQLGVAEPQSVLAHIGLPDAAHRSPHQLSEGQKRRLTLLYPCFQQRPLILLDEPTFGQDALNTLKIIQLIVQLKQRGHALIVITHDVAVQDAIANQIWQIDNGQLHVMDGSV